MIDLTVIIPLYNAEKHMFPMLTSIAMQKLHGLEVQYIFTCDSCKDKTYENCVTFLKMVGLYEKSIVKEIEVHSAGAARNYALDLAEGEFIWFLDDDDWLINENAFYFAVGVARRDNMKLMRIPFACDFDEKWCPKKHLQSVISMPWQYIWRRDLIGDDRFPAEPPIGYDTVFVMQQFDKLHIEHEFQIPTLQKELYYYNAFRVGSAMWRDAVDKGLLPDEEVEE